MRLEVHLSLEGAAFEDGLRDYEVAEILTTLAAKFRSGNAGAPGEVMWLRLHDANGNHVGFAVLTDDPLEGLTNGRSTRQVRQELRELFTPEPS